MDDDRIEILDRVNIQFKDNCCDIFVSFYFEDEDGVLSSRANTIRELLFIQELCKLSGESAIVECSDSMGCPFTEDEVGFFNIQQDFNKIDNILSAFLSIEINGVQKNIDVEYLKQNYTNIYYEYNNYNDVINDFFIKFLKNDYIPAFYSYHDLLSSKDLIYINRDRSVIIGFDEEGLDKLKNIIGDKSYKVNEAIYGIEYCFIFSNNKIVVIDTKTFKDVQYIMQLLGSDNSAIDNLFIISSYLLFKNDEQNVWFIINSYQDDQENYFLKEKNLLADLYQKIEGHLPQNIKIMEYDYNKLSSSEFENMCQDLLDEMGFINIKHRGNTKSADGGVDIEADFQIVNPFGIELQHWIFQCKHTKKQPDRKDIAEIPLLLEEFSAEGYGLFYSGSFSQQTIERIKKLKNCRTQYWGGRDLNIELRKKNRTALKYFGLNI